MTTQKIQQVALVGGTHGNELTGIELIRKFLRHPYLLKRKSFKTIPILGNPQAIKACQRFVDYDLNRSFDPKNLEVTDDSTTYEKQRAKEIKKVITSNKVDCIFDLHSTTSDVGLTVILFNHNAFNLNLAYYLQVIHGLKICSFYSEGQQTSFLNTLCANGFAIEVGPIAQGVLDYSLFEKTQHLIENIFDFIVQWNSGLMSQSESVTVYKKVKPVLFPLHSNELAGFIHPKIKNFLPIKTGDPLFITFDNQVVTLTETSGSGLYPFLVNEAAYYASNLAFYLMAKHEIAL
ncbi:MAG: aspartoacylase [Snowella sp.]|nr:aspartoacylase [Snowella sp.]